MCEMLLLNFGTTNADRLGFALISFLNTVSSCGLVVWLLLVTYVFSEHSCRLVRASLFEPLFNAVAALLYLGASSWVAMRVVRILLPLYQTTVFFESYPAMTSAYTFGLLLGTLHGVDAFMTFRHYRSSTCR
ncbi:Protein singles bar [Gryllus bimaculatus]|nr:Protein singles bar [Gryllus bimaculatus]